MQKLQLTQSNSIILNRFFSFSINVESLIYLFPIVMLFGRAILTTLYILFLFFFFCFERYRTNQDNIKLVSVFVWLFVLLWGLYVLSKTRVIFAGFTYELYGVYLLHDGIFYYLGTILCPFLLFTIITNIKASEDFFKNLFNVFTVTGVVLAFDLILDFILSGMNTSIRISGLWKLYNIVSAYLMIISFFNLSFVMSTKKSSEIIFRITGIFFMVIGILLTQTRGVFLAISFSIIIIFLKRPKIIVPVSIILGIVIIVFWSVIQSKFFSVKNFNKDLSSLGRIQAWYATFLLLKENYLTGYGFDSFIYLKDSVYDKFLLFLPHSHNTFLRSLLEMGLIGSIAYFYFFVKAFVYAFRKKFHNPKYREYYLGFQLFLVTLPVIFMFEPYLSLYANTLFIIWFLIALLFKFKIDL